MARPDETIALLRNNYEQFAQGNAEALFGSLSDDVQWSVSGPSPLRGVYRGKPEVRAFFGRMMELYGGTLRVQVVDVLAGEEHGVVLTEEEAEYKNKRVQFRSVHLWRLTNRRLSAFDVYYDDKYHAFWRDERS